jgi:hypothetical protein
VKLRRGHDPLHRTAHLLDRKREQELDGQRVEGLLRGLVGVRADLDAELLQDRIAAFAQNRDLGAASANRLVRQEPQDLSEAAELAVLVEHLDADAVEATRSMDHRLDLRLVEEDEAGVRESRSNDGRNAFAVNGTREAGAARIAEHSEPGPRLGLQGPVVPLRPRAVLAIAQEDEVVVGEPVEKAHEHSDALDAASQRACRELDLGRVTPQRLDHAAVIGDHVPQLREDALDFGLDRAESRGVVHARNLAVEVGLARRRAARLPDARDGAVSVPVDRHERMEQEQLAQAESAQAEAKRVDEEGDVRDQDLDRRPAVAGPRRVSDPHPDLSGLQPLEQGQRIARDQPESRVASPTAFARVDAGGELLGEDLAQGFLAAFEPVLAVVCL